MDDADRAQQFEEAEREAALAARKQAAPLTLVKRGPRCCCDCGAIIPAARLRAAPAAERCVDCQNAWEAKWTTR